MQDKMKCKIVRLLKTVQHSNTVKAGTVVKLGGIMGEKNCKLYQLVNCHTKCSSMKSKSVKTDSIEGSSGVKNESVKYAPKLSLFSGTLYFLLSPFILFTSPFSCNKRTHIFL